ncbi:MAG: leucine-rich repeat protein [Deltaproteobacteria bacterium]|nr:leucine-rich repeat protein [Deltaproteobacteria bacterium]
MFEDVKIPSKEARYFIRRRAQGDLFWESELLEDSVGIRSGKHGELGRSKVTSFDSLGAARKKTDQDIAKKVKAGFEELTDDAIWMRGLGKKPLLLRLPVDTKALHYNARFPPQRRLDLTHIAHLPELTEVDISELKLEELDLRPLAGCANLTKITLDVGVKTLELEHFSQCPQLLELSLETGLRDLDPARLAGCTKLESLKLYRLKGRTIALDAFAGFSVLHTLGLMRCACTKLDLAPLAACEGLSCLHLQYNTKLRRLDLTPLHGHENLKLVTVDEACELVGESEFNAEVRRFSPFGGG